MLGRWDPLDQDLDRDRDRDREALRVREMFCLCCLKRRRVHLRPVLDNQSQKI